MATIPKLKTAEYIVGHTSRTGISDGTVADVDLSAQPRGAVFAPLNNPDAFRRCRPDAELNTATWASGAGVAPQFLYEKATSRQADAPKRPSGGQLMGEKLTS